MTTLPPAMLIATPPTFATVEEERLHRKQRLAAGFRLFSKCGFDEGVAGHITARDPELSDHFWVNPFAMHFSQIKVSDLILVNEHGDVVQGSQPVNAAAFTGCEPCTTSPCSFTRIRSETLIWLKCMAKGFTQKWSLSSGSRAVM